MRTIEEVLYKSFYTPDTNIVNNNLRIINLPHYYNFNEMLACFLNLYKDQNITSNLITVITTTKYNYRVAVEKGFRALYLYDIIDFTDRSYYLKTNIQGAYIILDSCDSITSDLLYRILKVLDPYAIFYAFYDKFIPRRYNSVEDSYFISNNITYNLDKIKGDKSEINTYINTMLNNIRLKNNIEEILEKESPFIKKTNINNFDMSILDLSRVIITSNVTTIRNLNKKIRNFLRMNVDDPLQPKPNEYMISLGPSIALDLTNKKTINIPIGTRIQVLSSTPLNDNAGYIIRFNYENIDYSISLCEVNISYRFLDYMINGSSDYTHAPGTFTYYFAYVIGDFYSLSERYNEGIVLYDHTLSGDRKDLYTSILPIKHNLEILYNMKSTITY